MVWNCALVMARGGDPMHPRTHLCSAETHVAQPAVQPSASERPLHGCRQPARECVQGKHRVRALVCSEWCAGDDS